MGYPPVLKRFIDFRFFTVDDPKCSTHHEFSDSMSAIVDDQFVIAVNFEVIKSDHESFENGFRLESDHAVHIAFVGGYDYCPIDGLGDIGQKVVFFTSCAQFTNGD